MSEQWYLTLKLVVFPPQTALDTMDRCVLTLMLVVVLGVLPQYDSPTLLFTLDWCLFTLVNGVELKLVD